MGDEYDRAEDLAQSMMDETFSTEAHGAPYPNNGDEGAVDRLPYFVPVTDLPEDIRAAMEMTDADIADYERQRQEGMCMDVPEPIETTVSYQYGQIEHLKLSIEEGQIQLVCATCGKPPKWFEDFAECVSMDEVLVTSTLTGENGDGWERDADGPYIQLTIKKEVPDDAGTPEGHS